MLLTYIRVLYQFTISPLVGEGRAVRYFLPTQFSTIPHPSPFIPLLPQGSVECRLLTSVFYDFGKALSSTCPYSLDANPKLANDFLLEAFQLFIKQFPNLRLFDDEFASQKIETGSTKYTYQAFARLHARNGFKQGFKIMAKIHGK